MRLHEPFIRSIAGTLDDDTPRLIYADWLEDHGDPERAEFIRVQCEFARLGKDDPRRGPLHERQAQLLAEHRTAWLPPGWSFPAHPPETWRRGFVSRVQKRRGRLTREDGASLAAVPMLESLSLVQIGVTDGEFLHLPPLPNLRELFILLRVGGQLTDASFSHLGQWPALERLSLFATGLTNGGLAHLAAIRGLRSLAVGNELRGEALSDEGLAHLAGMTDLAELSFRSAGVTGRGLEVLATLPGLRKLAVGGCGLTEDAIPSLVRCRWLEELDLNHWLNRWDDGVGDRLLAALPQLPSLRVLHAARNDVTADGFRVLGRLTELEELAVGGTAFGDDELANLLGLHRLRRLGLYANQLTRAGLASLAALPGLRAVSLRDSHGEGAREALGDLRQLRWLDPGPSITDAGLGQLSGLPLLEELQLNSPFVTDAGLARLKRLPRLRRLSVNCGGVTNEFSWGRRAEWAPNLESLSLNGHTSGPTEWLSEGWRAY